MGLTRENRSEIKEIVMEALNSLVNEDFIDKIVEKMSIKFNKQLEKVQQQHEIQIREISRQYEEKLDNLEQYTRRNSIRIFGVPEIKNENLETTLISMFEEKANIKIKPDSFDRCHRLGPLQEKATRPIILKFISYQHRNTVMRIRKSFAKTGISIAEDLTKKRYILYKRAKEHFGFRNVWTADGTIKIKSEDKIHSIRTACDLDKFVTSTK